MRAAAAPGAGRSRRVTTGRRGVAVARPVTHRRGRARRCRERQYRRRGAGAVGEGPCRCAAEVTLPAPAPAGAGRGGRGHDGALRRLGHRRRRQAGRCCRPSEPGMEWADGRAGSWLRSAISCRPPASARTARHRAAARRWNDRRGCAKSDRAYSVLKRAFKASHGRQALQRPRAGSSDPSRGTIDAPLDRHPSSAYKFAVVESGRPSVTHYETVEAFRAASLLDIHLETGRTHQHSRTWPRSVIRASAT